MNVLNQKVKDISGGAVPVAEWIRNQAAAGATMWTEEMDAVEGMIAIRDALDAKEAQIIKSYTPEAVDRYRSRLGGDDVLVRDSEGMTEADFLKLSPEEQEEYLLNRGK